MKTFSDNLRLWMIVLSFKEDLLFFWQVLFEEESLTFQSRIKPV